MTFDPTKNDKPVCFMDPADLKALQECGGPWEFLNINGEWEDFDRTPSWLTKNHTYRQKPQPKLWWVMPSGNEYEASVVPSDGTEKQRSYMMGEGYTLMREVE